MQATQHRTGGQKKMAELFLGLLGIPANGILIEKVSVWQLFSDLD